VKLEFTPGNVNDCEKGLELVAGTPDSVLADKAYDTDKIVDALIEADIEVVIPPKRNRVVQRSYDEDKYKKRHLVENYFCKIKRFRRVATRYEQTIESYAGFVYLASILIL
jgi:putative transposase